MTEVAIWVPQFVSVVVNLGFEEGFMLIYLIAAQVTAGSYMYVVYKIDRLNIQGFISCFIIKVFLVLINS